MPTIVICTTCVHSSIGLPGLFNRLPNNGSPSICVQSYPMGVMMTNESKALSSVIYSRLLWTALDCRERCLGGRVELRRQLHLNDFPDRVASDAACEKEALLSMPYLYFIREVVGGRWRDPRLTESRESWPSELE